MSWEVRQGDALKLLRDMEPESVQCVVTSPPYWGLRDYGNEGQLGLEPTPDEYVANLVSVFSEVRRVLRDDGTVWLNLGDSYAGSGKGAWDVVGPQKEVYVPSPDGPAAAIPKTPLGLKPKDLCGIPWRVAFALQQPYYSGRITNELDRVWLAAMIDAEGCIFIHRRKTGQSNGQGYVRKQDGFGAGLEVSSTDRSIVERCMSITGLGSICEQGPEQNARRKQVLYRWNLRSNVCRDVLREVYPYLTAKKHEARLACGCPSSGESATAAWQTLKAIHQGGEHGDVDFAAPAFCLEPGWYLRSDIIWAKKNCVPESVTDRPTRSHEYIFLLTKSARYFYDADAVREDFADERMGNPGVYEPRYQIGSARNDGYQIGANGDWDGSERGGRNKRSVWTVATQPYSEAHFATFPPKLIEPCILAGSAEGDTVCDPFAGSGTTGMVALRHNRSFIGLELNPEYVEMARNRIRDDAPLFNYGLEAA